MGVHGIGINFTCDWCNGELEFFPQSKSGLRCKRCWRTEGNDDAPYSAKNKYATLKKQRDEMNENKKKRKKKRN